jgi:hypothetical protein
LDTTELIHNGGGHHTVVIVGFVGFFEMVKKFSILVEVGNYISGVS